MHTIPFSWSPPLRSLENRWMEINYLFSTLQPLSLHFTEAEWYNSTRFLAFFFNFFSSNYLVVRMTISLPTLWTEDVVAISTTVTGPRKISVYLCSRCSTTRRFPCSFNGRDIEIFHRSIAFLVQFCGGGGAELYWKIPSWKRNLAEECSELDGVWASL